MPWPTWRVLREKSFQMTKLSSSKNVLKSYSSKRVIQSALGNVNWAEKKSLSGCLQLQFFWTERLTGVILSCYYLPCYKVLKRDLPSKRRPLQYPYSNLPSLAPFLRKQMTTAVLRHPIALSKGLIPLLSTCSTAAPLSIKYCTCKKNNLVENYSKVAFTLARFFSVS